MTCFVSWSHFTIVWQAHRSCACAQRGCAWSERALAGYVQHKLCPDSSYDETEPTDASVIRRLSSVPPWSRLYSAAPVS